MRSLPLAVLLLRLRLGLSEYGPLACVGAALCLAAAAALLWLAPQRAVQGRQQAVALRMAALPPAAIKSAPAIANDNLAVFYKVLGEQRHAEQQVKTLFALAAGAGLTLSQGEYRGAFDASARLHTYQIILPVRGSYRAIWNFALLALRAIPFASLDEISFQRDEIGNAEVEARLRLTMYLADQDTGAAP